MGLFDSGVSNAISLLSGPQQDFLTKNLIPYGRNLLSLGTDLGQQAGQVGTGAQLSLAGLEQMAMGGQAPGAAGPGQATTDASNQALQQILGRNPLDVNDFVNSTVLDPGLREYDKLAPLLEREFAAGGTRFGSPAARGLSDLLEGVSKATNAARAAAALNARQQNLTQQLQAAGLGQQAAGQAAGTRATQAATLANIAQISEAIRLQALERALGLPAGALSGSQALGLQATKALGSEGTNLMGAALSQAAQGWLSPGGLLPGAGQANSGGLGGLAGGGGGTGGGLMGALGSLFAGL